ncbi:MAG TPA: diphthine synthase [Candidatus Acidoferrum sp.]|nr:diphthine synthase [Candidatus Acidoferrum sp.]
MGELIFIGLGLHDETGISLRGVEVARSCDMLFAEFYTNLMSGLSIPNLEKIVGMKITILSRAQVEEESIVVAKAKTSRVGFLVPGDPLVATTHVDLRLRAERSGIKTRILHAASITSAIAGTTGLQSYKFGRTVTMPSTANEKFPESVYTAIRDNQTLGLHSLVLLEIDVEAKRHITIAQATQALLDYSKQIPAGIINPQTLTIGVARVGAPDMMIQAGRAGEIAKRDFGKPPHTLIIPGRLHFVEAEAVEVICGAPRGIMNE